MKRTALLVLLITIVTFAHAQKTNDSLAIVHLLEKESTTYRNGDVKAHASCWQVQPYTKILVSTTDGHAFYVPPQSINNPPAGSLGNGGTFANSNYNMSIHGNDAWVCHDEVSTSVAGVNTYSHELKILEKIGGEWKLVAATIMLYKPE